MSRPSKAPLRRIAGISRSGARRIAEIAASWCPRGGKFVPAPPRKSIEPQPEAAP